MAEGTGEKSSSSISARIKGLSEYTAPINFDKMRADLDADTPKGAFIGKSVAQLENSNRKLKKEAANMREESRTDFLTGLGNRRALDELVTGLEEVRDRQSDNSIVSQKGTFICLDLTALHNINESFGYTNAGDVYIRSVADSIIKSIRASDRAFRIGGDEFVIHLSNMTSREEIEEVLDRIDQQIDLHQKEVNDYVRYKDVKYSVSSSVARYSLGSTRPDEACFIATEELNKAKELKRQEMGQRGGNIGRIFN